MLLDFSVTNYKSIKDTQSLSLAGSHLAGPHKTMDVNFPGGGHGMLPFAIIYGANASGKSNILEALVTMKHMVRTSHNTSDRTGDLRREPFLLEKKYKAKPTVFEVAALIDGVRHDYGFSYMQDGILEEWLYSYPESRRRKLFERDGMDISFGASMRGPKKQLSSFIKKSALFLSTATQNNHEELGKLSDFFRDIFTSKAVAVEKHYLNLTFRENEIDQRTISFLNAIGTGVCSYDTRSSEIPEDRRSMLADLFKVLKKHHPDDESGSILEPDEKDVEITLGHKGLEGEIVFFDGDLESAGTRRLLVLMNSLFQVLDAGDIAIVDELDASLHTYAVEAVIELFLDKEINRHGAQLIATTHDTNLLNPKKLRRDEIWFVEKDRSGASQYFSLAEFNTRRTEVFEKTYLQGRYGAVPPRFMKSLLETG